MFLLTTDQINISGYEIDDYLGIVEATAVRTTPTTIIGSIIRPSSKRYDDAVSSAFHQIALQAEEMNADGIIGIKISTSVVSRHYDRTLTDSNEGDLYATVMGTAVTIRKSTPGISDYINGNQLRYILNDHFYTRYKAEHPEIIEEYEKTKNEVMQKRSERDKIIEKYTNIQNYSKKITQRKNDLQESIMEYQNALIKLQEYKGLGTGDKQKSLQIKIKDLQAALQDVEKRAAVYSERLNSVKQEFKKLYDEEKSAENHFNNFIEENKLHDYGLDNIK